MKKKCLSEDKRGWSAYLRNLPDEIVIQKLHVTEPSWDCGPERWRLWKRLVAQEAQRRGLGT